MANLECGIDLIELRYNKSPESRSGCEFIFSILIVVLISTDAGCPNGAADQSPGLAALFAAYPGRGFDDSVNPERVAPTLNPFRVESLCAVFPGLAARNAANPGLYSAALSGQPSINLIWTSLG